MALAVASCEEDRIVEAQCRRLPNTAIAVDFSKSDASPDIGLLNPKQFLPGTLIELQYGPSDQRGTGRVAYVLSTATHDYLEAPPIWRSGKVHAAFDIQTDDDVLQESKGIATGIRTEIESNTWLVVSAARKSLRDPILLLNADPRAIEFMREAPRSSRFLLVTSVALGRGAALYFYSESSPAMPVSTFRASRFYLHVNYSCAELAGISSRAVDSQADIPLFFFFQPVIFSPPHGGVQIDARSLSLEGHAW